MKPPLTYLGIPIKPVPIPAHNKEATVPIKKKNKTNNKKPADLIAAMHAAMHKIKNKKPGKTDERNGVDQIIAYLVRERKNIGAIVLGVAPLAKKQLRSIIGDGMVDGQTLSADLVAPCNDREKRSISMLSPMTRGVFAVMKSKIEG